MNGHEPRVARIDSPALARTSTGHKHEDEHPGLRRRGHSPDLDVDLRR